MTSVQGEDFVPLRGAAPASDLRLSPLLADRHDAIKSPIDLPSAIEAIDLR